MHSNRSYLLATVIIVSIFFLGGCLGKGTQRPTEFFLLQPLDSSIEKQESAVGEGVVLGIGPVSRL